MIPSICVTAPDLISFQIMAGPESLFTEAQLKEIILQYGKLGSATLVQRWFRKQYPDIQNSRIPSVTKFWNAPFSMEELRHTVTKFVLSLSSEETRRHSTISRSELRSTSQTFCTITPKRPGVRQESLTTL